MGGDTKHERPNPRGNRRKNEEIRKGVSGSHKRKLDLRARNVFTAHKYLIRMGPADVKVDQKQTFVPVTVSFPKKMFGSFVE